MPISALIFLQTLCYIYGWSISKVSKTESMVASKSFAISTAINVAVETFSPVYPLSMRFEYEAAPFRVHERMALASLKQAVRRSVLVTRDKSVTTKTGQPRSIESGEFPA
jgi:hypothetical protein